MKKKVFYKHWWVHCFGVIVLLFTIFILTEKKQFFQINKKNTTTLDNEHWAKVSAATEAAIINNLAKETQDLQTAEELYKRSLQNIADNEKYIVLYNLGATYADHNMHEKAIKEYTAALDINKECYDCYVGRGASYEEIFELKLAMNDYDTAIKINPKGTRAYLNKGHFYKFMLHDYMNAKINFSKCIEIDKKYYEAYIELIVLNLLLNITSEAEEVLNDLKNINTNDNFEMTSASLIGQATISAYRNESNKYFNIMNEFIEKKSGSDVFIKNLYNFTPVKSVFLYGIDISMKNKDYATALNFINSLIKLCEIRNLSIFIEKLNKDKLFVEKLLKNEIPNFEYKKGMLAISE